MTIFPDDFLWGGAVAANQVEEHIMKMVRAYQFRMCYPKVD